MLVKGFRKSTHLCDHTRQCMANIVASNACFVVVNILNARFLDHTSSGNKFLTTKTHFPSFFVHSKFRSSQTWTQMLVREQPNPYNWKVELHRVFIPFRGLKLPAKKKLCCWNIPFRPPLRAVNARKIEPLTIHSQGVEQVFSWGGREIRSLAVTKRTQTTEWASYRARHKGASIQRFGMQLEDNLKTLLGGGIKTNKPARHAVLNPQAKPFQTEQHHGAHNKWVRDKQKWNSWHSIFVWSWKNHLSASSSWKAFVNSFKTRSLSLFSWLSIPCDSSLALIVAFVMQKWKMSLLQKVFSFRGWKGLKEATALIRFFRK